MVANIIIIPGPMSSDTHTHLHTNKAKVMALLNTQHVNAASWDVNFNPKSNSLLESILLYLCILSCC